MSFSSFALAPSLKNAIANLSLKEPTAIQAAALPPALLGKDILGIAKTGSGKTLAFTLPCIQKVIEQHNSGIPTKHRAPSVLILVPTRELAQQIDASISEITIELSSKVSSIAIFGGVSINPQMQSLGKTDILVATPGRLLDLHRRNALRIDAVNTLVFDEADKILNLGFREEINDLLMLLPQKRQNLLFSATLDEKLTPFQHSLLSDPELVHISSNPNLEQDPKGAESELESIHQQAYHVTSERKGPLLRYLIKFHELQQILVFASSTHRVDAIVDKLLKNNIDAASIHGKKSQTSRHNLLKEFKDGTLNVLVTTDLLARGIDIDKLATVINYELPRSPKDYIHRIGRTGRAAHYGNAISLVSPEELHHFRVIQKKMKKRVTMQQSDALNLHGY